MEQTIKEGARSFAWLLMRLLIIDPLAMCILVGFWWWPRDLIKFLTNKIIITNKRITGKIGIIHTEELDSPLRQITGAKVEQGLGGKMFNYGTIIITTAANVYKFDMIDHPNEFKTILLQQVEKSEEDRMELQAQKMAQAFKSK